MRVCAAGVQPRGGFTSARAARETTGRAPRSTSSGESRRPVGKQRATISEPAEPDVDVAVDGDGLVQVEVVVAISEGIDVAVQDQPSEMGRE